jgi:phage terminase large subunit-like protein
VIWAAEDTDDPFVESTWRKANPGLGKSPTLAYMRREAAKAQTTQTYYPTFCRLSLNLRKREQTRWLDVAKWDACGGPVDRSVGWGRRAWGGLDLSAVSDFTAWAAWVEPVRPGAELELLTRFWIPEERVEDLERKLLVPLRKWHAEAGYVGLHRGRRHRLRRGEGGCDRDCNHLDMQRWRTTACSRGSWCRSSIRDLRAC